ncbi:iron chaperone [Fictibacillus phosphorivorans]|uniref:Iron chaperone n=1 Tax=Fictibacillus phosphorivorans TaxID=1221500 RepID=A0A160INW9_9BACL|nr:iron chaperone [Fictibacillus phosphorivorans]ANC77292.1 iron chaperone [Fictibacillus phosphorivorans]MQR94527.1 iron chaperone [Fictibacillus phosphorivorans]
MEVFSDYLAGIDDPDHRNRMDEVLKWVAEKFPSLEPQFKWNTPMYTDHGTFIIGISMAKQHISIAPEEVTMVKFADDIKKAGYTFTKGLFRIRWKDEVNYELLEKMISFNIEDKAHYTKFWRE